MTRQQVFRHALLLTIFGCSVAFGTALIHSWVNQVNQQVTCQLNFGKLETISGYVEVQLKRQHPIEPYFEGKLFLVSHNPKEFDISTISVTRSAQGTYNQSRYDVPMYWDKDWNALHARALTSFDLVTQSGPHLYFPFDSAHFVFSLELSPPLDYKGFRLVNHVPGFILPCDMVKGQKSVNGDRLYMTFSIYRSPLTQLAVCVFGAAAFVFIPLIAMLTKVEDLAVSVASYFFAVWSIRAILASEIKTFPTLLDCWLLTASMLMIVALFLALSWRVWHPRSEGIGTMQSPEK